MPAIYIANVSNAGDEEEEDYNLSRSVLTAIIGCTILFILLLLGFTLVWRHRRTFQRRSPTTTTEFAGPSPNISFPAPAYDPQRKPYSGERSH
ncbi:hypothetical protein ARMGADRAFT_1021154, partial [Armillaria gallica]